MLAYSAVKNDDEEHVCESSKYAGQVDQGREASVRP